MTNLIEIAKEIEARPEVYSVNVWKDRRVYVNFVGYNPRFAGDRNHKVYYDIKAGWVEDGNKGTKSSAYSSSVAKFYNEVMA